MTSILTSASIPAGPDAAYAAYLAQGRFMIQHCAACGGHVFFPRVLCPHCGVTGLEWVAASGGATVYSATIVRRKPQHGGDYNVVLVDLDEGPRMMSRVEGVPLDAVRIGMKVNAMIKDGQGAQAGERFVVFHPAEVRA